MQSATLSGQMLCHICQAYLVEEDDSPSLLAVKKEWLWFQEKKIRAEVRGLLVHLSDLN